MNQKTKRTFTPEFRLECAQLMTIIAVIVALLFGTKKLVSLGSDLGASIRGFKKAMVEEDGAPAPPLMEQAQPTQSHAGQDAKNRDTLQG